MNPICKQCGQREVEDARVCFATPVCFACLPPPRPLNTAWSLPAVWLADMAEALEHVRHEDSAPKLLTPDVLLGLVNELREDRDHWKKRAESAEYALGPYLCPKCQKCLSQQELDHTMCRACAEKDMAKRLGAGLLDLPADWYDNTPDRGPQ